MSTTNYLWISVVGNVVAVILIPFVGNLTDRIGRRPVIIVGCAGLRASWPTPTCTSSAQDNLPMAFLFAILMWGIVYQGYNAVFPSFYQELFPTKTRVTAFAVSQNIGTLITAFLPAIYAALVGPTPGACVVDKKFAPDVHCQRRDLPRSPTRSRSTWSGRSAASRSGWRSSRPSRRSAPARRSAST